MASRQLSISVDEGVKTNGLLSTLAFRFCGKVFFGVISNFAFWKYERNMSVTGSERADEYPHFCSGFSGNRLL